MPKITYFSDGGDSCATSHAYVEEKLLPLLKPMAEDEHAMPKTAASQ